MELLGNFNRNLWSDKTQTFKDILEDFFFFLVYHILFIHYLVEGHLACFQFLDITNKATMNRIEQASSWHRGVYFGHMPRSGILGSSGRTISKFLRNQSRLISKVVI